MELKKKSLEGFNRRMEIAEERVSDLEDKKAEITESEKERKNFFLMSRNSGACGEIYILIGVESQKEGRE